MAAACVRPPQGEATAVGGVVASVLDVVGRTPTVRGRRKVAVPVVETVVHAVPANVGKVPVAALAVPPSPEGRLDRPVEGVIAANIPFLVTPTGGHADAKVGQAGGGAGRPRLVVVGVVGPFAACLPGVVGVSPVPATTIVRPVPRTDRRRRLALLPFGGLGLPGAT